MLNLGFNYTVICLSLTPWAPFWANWQCLGCLASTFSGFCVAGRILPVLGPQNPPGSTLVTISRVLVASSLPGLHSGLTGSVGVAWLPQFQVSVLHGGFCPFWAPQDPPGSTLVTIPHVFVLFSLPEIYPGLTDSIWVAWLPHFQVSVLHGGFCPFWAPQDPPGSTLVTIPHVFVLFSLPEIYPGLTDSIWVAWLPHFQVSVLHGGFCPFWAPQDPPGSTLVTITQVFVLPSPPGLHSGQTGSVWVAWLPHFQVSVLHGGFCPFWAPQDTPGSTLVTITQVFVLTSPPELHSGLTGCV